ncbi:monooxygenase [Cavenderia fasciculata]|uniref:Ubiquinone biosynthesis monooxygenase COQ6, mitochondrial n=1 Tax=Cavenderia fasciculata TaxID=261658 RepID=F4QFS2_CACFS|nr:monooxygenase [Cavenderia fasciculata]EGG14319.1 monooxygenase [Cavenderia fasciculata]|eukprot:XP_004351028.1 monooxygenase [Cavenderia fasciculata]
MTSWCMSDLVFVLKCFLVHSSIYDYVIMLSLGLKRVLSSSSLSLLRSSSTSTCYRYYSSEQVEKYDIVIVGGGLVGSSMACALGSSDYTKHLKVCLVESAPIQPLHPLTVEHDIRTLSFNNTSVALFDAIGAWDLIKGTRIAPFNQLRVWDSSGFPGIHFKDNDAMGYILENRVVNSALLERSRQLDNVTIKSPVQVKSVELTTKQSSSKSRVFLSNDQQLETDLIIAADGGNSIIKKQIGVSSHGRNYNQKAVVCTIKLAPNHQPNTLYQRFLPTGPIALLPLSDGYASIIWSTNTIHANYLLSLDDESFMVQLNHAWFSPSKISNDSVHDALTTIFDLNPSGLSGQELHLPPIEKVSSKRASFPLRLDHTLNYTDKGLCLIGDAAHLIHPLAGQGVNLGLADVIALSKTISESVKSGYNVGDSMMLKKYEDERKIENIKMLASVDTLFNLFENNSFLVKSIRNIGLSILDNITPLKNLITSVSKGTKISLKGIGSNQN